jgi:phospholipid/cholesterol/gamma-HCH transport system substrate-binding protein
VKTAVRKHWKDFGAIIVLAVIGLVVAMSILGHQRFYLPRWVPVLGTDFVDYKATFSTAQSLTPGQGQTVQIAGVDVGDITKVELVDGQAVVTMKIRRKYTPIHKDATALLRPKTGLNDMVVQLNPGSRSAGKAPAGWSIPIAQTQPNVNADEVLAALDGDTRNYLQMLVGGAGQALKGNGPQLSATLKRFEPTGSALARLNGALATRQSNIRRSIHNFRLLAEALGNKDNQLAQLVDSSNRVFRSFARQDQNLRAALQELPGTLNTTNTALTKAGRMAKQLGPTLGALRPGARALGPALAATRPFLRETTPIVRDQLRPFARDARPVVNILRPAARDLSKITPDLVSSFKTINYALNELAYNPPGSEEGYLFWASWANHVGATLFNMQDAHGPIRRGLVLASCSTLQTLRVIGTANPLLGTLADLLNAPTVEQACGQKTTQPGATPPATPTAAGAKGATG